VSGFAPLVERAARAHEDGQLIAEVVAVQVAVPWIAVASRTFWRNGTDCLSGDHQSRCADQAALGRGHP
jgi:hypothetical protein